MSAATVMCVDRLSLASSSVGSLRTRLGNQVIAVVEVQRKEDTGKQTLFAQSRVLQPLH